MGESRRDFEERDAARAPRACATEMIRRSANPWHVKELLGHEDFRSLDVYAKLTILDLKAAHRKYHPREQRPEGEDPPEETPGAVPVRR